MSHLPSLGPTYNFYGMSLRQIATVTARTPAVPIPSLNNGGGRRQ